MNRILGPLTLLFLGTLAALFFRARVRPPLPAGKGCPPPVSLPSSPPHPSSAQALSREPDPFHRIPAPSPPPPQAGGRPLLSGRLVDTRGRPLGPASWRLLFIPAGRRRGEVVLGAARTDRAGRFLAPLPGKVPPGEVGLEIRPMAKDGRPRPEGGKARTDLILPLPRGITRLGTLVLTPLPLLLSGKVLSSRGEPLRGVELELWAWKEGRPGPSPIAPPEPRGTPPPSGTWRPLPLRPAFSEMDGTFQFRGTCSSSLLQVRTRGKGGWFLENPPSVPPGTAGLNLVLSPGGRLEGRLEPPSGAKPGDFLLLLYPSHLQDQAHPGLQAGPGPEGSFLLEGIPPGPARLEVRNALDGRILLDLKGLEILPGRTCRDQRLRPLDLSQGGPILTLRVRTTAGKAIPNPMAMVSGRIPRIYRGKGGILHLPTRVRGEPVFLWAPGYQATRLPDRAWMDRKWRKVTLEPGIPIRLEMDPRLPLPEGPFRLELHLSLADLPASPEGRAAAFFMGRSGLPLPSSQGGRSFPAVLPCPGVYRLALGITWRSGFLEQTIWAGKTQKFRVSPSDSNRTVPISLERKIYSALLRRARRAYPRRNED